MEISFTNRLAFGVNRLVHHVTGHDLFGQSINRRIYKNLSDKPKGKTLSIEKVQNLGAEDLYRNYILKGKPVILESMAQSWPCVQNWTPEYLSQKYGDQVISVSDNVNTGGIFNVEDMKFSQFIDSMVSGDTKKYLRFGNLLHLFPELLNDFDHRELTRYMGKWRFGNNAGVFMGAKNTKTTLHAAPPHNLFTQVYGTKHWVIYDAGSDPFLAPTMDRSTFFSTVYDPDTPDFENYPCAQYLDRYEFELNPGDILYNPPSFWHQVTNKSANIGVGFRWMSPMTLKLNFMQVLLFLMATNPSLLFVLRNKKQYAKVLAEAEKKNRLRLEHDLN